MFRPSASNLLALRPAICPCDGRHHPLPIEARIRLELSKVPICRSVNAIPAMHL